MINKIGLIFGIIGLIASGIWGVMYYNNKKRTAELIAQSAKSLAEREAASKLKQDSILLEINKKDSTIKDLEISQREAKKQLNQSIQTGKALATDLKKARLSRDTGMYYQKCDSLAEHVTIVEAENAVYQAKIDSFVSALRERGFLQDSLLREKDKLYSGLRTAFASSALKIDELQKSNKKLDLKLERSKRTTRLVALLGIFAAGTIYITTK